MMNYDELSIKYILKSISIYSIIICNDKAENSFRGIHEFIYIPKLGRNNKT